MAENDTSKNAVPPAGTDLSPEAPLDTMEVEFDSAAGGPQVNNAADDATQPAGADAPKSHKQSDKHQADKAPSDKAQVDKSDASSSDAGGVKQLVSDTTQKLTAFSGEKARAYAEDGKAKAGGLLDELVRLLQDAAGNVDDKLGEQYGNYARTAADSVSGFSGKVKDKDLDELIAEARTFVEKSPGVAIGTAAALGFVLVRLVKSGLDANKAQA
jgi:ElaB/YqjD/DUF883 family membrane-anchored ribosome-binding protein